MTGLLNHRPRPCPARIITVVITILLIAGLAYAEKTCPSCGTENSENARFCKKCGTRLPAAPTRPAIPSVDVSVRVDRGVATITSEPAGAAVFVDDRPEGNTPLALHGLSAGRHELRVTNPDYRDYVGAFTVTGSFGSVVVTSDPAGADVLLDGSLQGRTVASGLVLDQVQFGPHTLTVRASGYRDIDKTIEVKSTGQMAADFRLEPVKGFLRVVSEPTRAKVLSAGRVLGESPILGEFDPGRYMLTLTKRGFHDWTGYADLQPAETALVRVVLDRVETRKTLFLVAGIVGIAGGGYAAFRGESEYARYRSASTQQGSERYKASTQTWDVVRNVVAGFGGAMLVAFFTLRW